jgi:hypothetical protein
MIIDKTCDYSATTNTNGFGNGRIEGSAISDLRRLCYCRTQNKRDQYDYDIREVPVNGSGTTVFPETESNTFVHAILHVRVHHFTRSVSVRLLWTALIRILKLRSGENAQEL